MIRIKCVLLALFFLSSVMTMSTLLTPEDEHGPTARAMQASYTISVNVTVVDNYGRNISGATIHIRDNSSTWQTNDSGYWEINGLADDVIEYRLYASKANYLADSDVVLPVLGNESYNVTLRIIGGTILGTVTSQSGFILGASVSILDPMNFSANVSPADGTYTLTGIPGGTYSVTAGAPGYTPMPKTVSVTAGEAAQLNFILIPLNGNISGFVIHATTLGPLSNATVSVNLTDKTIAVQSIENGSYQIPGVPEGTYTVVASKEGYYSVSMGGIVVNRGNTTENVNFTLADRPTALFGTVKSGALLLRLVNISLVGAGLFNISDSSGDYRIENITAGKYNVSVVRDGYVTTVIADVVIPVGGSIELDIDLVALPGAVLIGTVVDRDNPEKALYNVIVTIFMSDEQQRTEFTDPLGHFGFTELAAGNYTLQFEVAGYGPLEIRNVAVKENETTNMTFKMEPVRNGFEGFIFGFDLAHSMMILALFITIVILAVAVYLRYRTFQTPETAPAVYDQEEEPAEKKEDEIAAESDKNLEKEDEL